MVFFIRPSRSKLLTSLLTSVRGMISWAQWQIMHWETKDQSRGTECVSITETQIQSHVFLCAGRKRMFA